MALLLINLAQGILRSQVFISIPSLIAGISFHFIVARPDVEFEHYTLSALGVAGCATGLDFAISVTTRHLSIPTAVIRLCLAWSGFLIGLISSLTFYRLLFHRCRTFPGPFAASLTRFYAAYLNAQDEQFYRKLAKLHEKYGDYMRIGPRELSILDPEAIRLLYGSKSTCTKGTFYAMNGGGTDDTISINGIRNPANYRPRRRAWDRGLSMKALAIYQPRIEAQASELVRQIRLQAYQPIDVSTWSMFFGFDVMGDVGFSRDFGNLRTRREHPAIRAMHSFLWTLSVVQTIPWLPRMMNKMPGATKGVAEFYELCAEVLEEKQKTFDSGKEPQDMISWLLKAGYDKDGSASPTPDSLADDNRGMIIAGSDTSSNTLANALFYLAKHQHIQTKLRTQLRVAKERNTTSWNYSSVKSVTYLDDIINETLRLKPPIIQGVPRETPAGGIRIGNKYIPGHVAASVPTILIQRDPRWWQDADEFIPERWTERKEEMNTNAGLWIPFGLGMHACAGKNLGYMMLRTAISMLVENFDIAFAEGETGERFDGEFLSSFMMVLRPLRLVFTPRAC